MKKWKAYVTICFSELTGGGRGAGGAGGKYCGWKIDRIFNMGFFDMAVTNNIFLEFIIWVAEQSPRPSRKTSAICC